MIVGQFGKVFELGKNFRNEGVDLTHVSDFPSSSGFLVERLTARRRTPNSRLVVRDNAAESRILMCTNSDEYQNSTGHMPMLYVFHVPILLPYANLALQYDVMVSAHLAAMQKHPGKPQFRIRS